jgi:hypothetical protein
VDTTQIAHSAALVIDPNVETAMWLIFAALGAALVLILSEMVKNRK